MSDNGSLIPVSDEQAKAVQELIKLTREFGSFFRQALGTMPEDIVGLLGGDRLNNRRKENIEKIRQESRERLKARGIDPDSTEAPSLSVMLPILIASADESRDELQELWARLLAAAADPKRAPSFRFAFIEAAKKMDPLDAEVLRLATETGGGNIDGHARKLIADRLERTRDEVDVSVANLERLGLAATTERISAAQLTAAFVTAFGREFLRAVSD